ncbi:MAG: type 1 glutamine amidotransferase [Cyclobacteriaceae bacterium]
MKLLVVEGNPKELWAAREEMGGVAYHKRFKSMISLLCPDAEVAFAFPADHKPGISLVQLSRFDGILLTGSSLFLNDNIPEVTRQLEFADLLFDSGLPIYGSCWGLQVAAVVAGGNVSQCEKGREFGISSPIELSEDGRNHDFFKSRESGFQSLCIHADEVSIAPSRSTILAKNKHSKIQAMCFKYKASEFFGVQYHPEFKISDMIFIANIMSDRLISDGQFESKSAVTKFISKLENKERMPDSVLSYQEHIQEVTTWLNNISAKPKKS